jgi:hypothetical protein
VAVLIPRIRTLGVRLSEEEYSALEKFSIETGARSMSDVARSAICDFVRHSMQENPLASAMSGHTAQVEDLKDKLEKLTAEIEFLKQQKHRD